MSSPLNNKWNTVIQSTNAFLHEDIHHLLLQFVQWTESRGVSMWFELLLDVRKAHPHMILTLASHPPTLAECSWLVPCVTRSPPTQASWYLASCGQWLFITFLSDGQLSQTQMVLPCSSLMGSCIYVIARTLRQPNYPNQLTSKRGSQSSLMFHLNPMWWANGGNISIVQAGDTLSRGPYQPFVLTSLWSHLWLPAAN